MKLIIEKLFILIFCILIHEFVSSQPLFTVYNDHSVECIGPSGSTISSINHSSDGTLWCVSLFHGGISYFNNGKWQYYWFNTGADQVPDNSFEKIHIDLKGNIYFYGLGVIMNSTACYSDSNWYLLGHKDIYDMCTDRQNKTWIAGFDGLYYFDDAFNITEYPGILVAEPPYYAIRADDDGNLYIGCAEGLIKMSNGQNQLLTFDSPLVATGVYSLVYDDSEKLWMSGENWIGYLKGNTFRVLNQNISDFDGYIPLFYGKKYGIWFIIESAMAENAIFYCTESSVFPFPYSYNENDYVISVYENNNDIYLAYYTNGIGYYHKDTTVLYQGANINETNSLIKDKNGNIWFSTTGGLHTLWTDNTWTLRNLSTGFADVSFRGSIEMNQKLWFGHSNGLISWDGEIFENYSYHPDGFNRIVTGIVAGTDSSVWVATGNDYLYHFKNNVFEKVIPDINYPGIIAVFSDYAHHIWICAMNDYSFNSVVYRYDGINWNYIGLYNGFFMNFTQDKTGKIWAVKSFGSDGLYYYTGSHFIRYNIPGENHFMPDFVYFDSQNRLWYTKECGAAFFYNNKITRIHIDSLTNDSLNSMVKSVYEDQDGNFYLITYYYGIFKMQLPSSIITPLILSGNCSVYPNPVSGNLYIASNKIISGVEIYNLAGQLFMRENCNTYSFHFKTDSLTKGAYILKIFYSDNSMEIRKIIIP